MADQTIDTGSDVYDPSYNPTEPYRPWSMSTLLVRIGIGLCVLWLLWEHVGADYVCGGYQQRGLACMQQNLYHDAAEQFSGMIRIEPSYYMGYQLRAQANDQMGLYKDEIADETKALALLSPPYVSGAWTTRARADAFYARAHAEDLNGSYDAAIADYSSCLAATPDSFDARLGRANDYRRTGRYRLALDEFDAAERLRPDDPAANAGKTDMERALANGPTTAP